MLQWLLSIEANYSMRCRTKRAKLFAECIKLKPDDVVLDLGGGAGDHFHSIYPHHKRVVVADILSDDLKRARENYGYRTIQLTDDMWSLPFNDQEFDVVFCSSVIEHVTGPKKRIEWISNFEKAGRLHQWMFADEIRRIAKRYYVQTPYRYFIIESHTSLPGVIVLLPRAGLVRLLRFTNTFWPKRTAPDFRLLTITEFTKMFPDADIKLERSFGFVKSLMAIRS